jgi:hypothetical protein
LFFLPPFSPIYQVIRKYIRAGNAQFIAWGKDLGDLPVRMSAQYVV